MGEVSQHIQHDVRGFHERPQLAGGAFPDFSCPHKKKGPGLARHPARALISQKVFIKFCKSQFLHKSVNLFFILVIVKDKLTDLWES